MDARPNAWSWSRRFVVLGMFFVCYLHFRAFDVLFTLSDAFLLAGLGFLMFGRGVAMRPFVDMTPIWHVSAGVMMAALLASSMATGSLDRWIPVAIQYVYALVLLPMILLIDDQKRWRTLAYAYLAGIVVMEIATAAIIIFFRGDYDEIYSRFGRWFYTGIGRVGSFVGDPNRHAAVLCMSLPFLYYLKLTTRLPLWVFLASLGVIFTALAYTASATGFATAIVVSVLFAVIARLRATLPLAAGAAAAIVAIIAFDAPLPSAFERRVMPALESGSLGDAGTFTGRMALIKEAWGIADDTMVIGLGVDRYREISEHRTPVHNVFFLLWTEGGFFALLGWLGMMGVLAAAPLGALRERPRDAALALCVFAVFLVFSVTSTHMYARVWMVPVLLALGPALALRSKRR